MIVDAAQINIYGNLPIIQRPVKMLRPSFRYRQVTDAIEVLVQ